MANLEFSNYNIRAIATSVPKDIRTTESLAPVFGVDLVEKIKKNVGVLQGHLADSNTTTSDLCEHAANIIINKLNINRNSIDVLLFVSQTPDYIAPSTACVLQHRLSLSNDCLAYDMNLACSAFVYGLSAVLSYLNQPNINRVLLLCGDTVSKHCSPLDRQLALLSYDAGSAILIDKNNESQKKSFFTLKTIGSGYRNLIVPYGGYRHRIGDENRYEREPGVVRNDYDGYMNGPEVFKFSISEVPKMIKEFKSFFQINFDDIDRHFLHQANIFIIQNISKRIGIDFNNVPISIDRYGNTGATTIPLTICDYYAKSNEVCISEKISICGFGIGLSLGVGVLEFDKTIIFPIEICEKYYDDNIDNLHNETTKMVND
jgi:3-oxoacyl-[acyl-carrier-protein] synthase III